MTPSGPRRAAALLVALLAATAVDAQSPPPAADWRTFDTEHFRVTFTPDLEPVARHAADVAERTHAVLREELADPPGRRIDLVVTNHVDYSNGFAKVFPSDRIVVYARPPTATPQLAYVRDWIELVVAHEVVHIFHLSEPGILGRVTEPVFGRLPLLWPLYPVVGSPSWNVEGLATWYESRLTGAGRVRGSFHDMIARTAALEDEIPPLDDLSAPHPAWPGGQRAYGYGSRLMAWIAEQYGEEAHAAIVEATGRSLRPTFLAFDHVARRALGRSFESLWDEWRSRERERVLSLADSLRELGLTRFLPVAGDGPYAVRPRVSPDGRALSFAVHDYRSDPATRLLDLGTGRVYTVGERNQLGGLLGPASWLPDGTGMVIAQLEFQGPYRLISDLWRIDLRGRETRLTRGERLAQPDIAPDGRRVAATRNRDGALDLVVHDLESGETRTLQAAGARESFDGPRWSPDGRTIAVARHAGGRVDLVVIDVESGTMVRVTHDDALDLSPAWTPDGRHLLWVSDRSGIPNVYAVRIGRDRVPTGPVLQVTNVLTGVDDPEVSPDGDRLYLTRYHVDGWRIEATPLTPAEWRPAAPPVLRHGPAVLAGPEGPDTWPDTVYADTVSADTTPPAGSSYSARGQGTDAPGGAQRDSGSRPYSPWPTLRPYHWLPELETRSGTGGSLTFVGARVEGRDVLARHSWSAGAAVAPGSGRFAGDLAWTYRGLEPVDLRFAADRRWSAAGIAELEGGEEEAVWRRTTELRADAVVWRSRWRSLSWLRGGIETERRVLEGDRLTPEELRQRDADLVTDRRTIGASVGGGYGSALRHPLAISPQDGVALSASVGRWVDPDGLTVAYDEVVGSAAGYVGLDLGGFADHVLAIRAAGLVRTGDAAAPTSIGGVPGPSLPLPGPARDLIGADLSGGAFFPSRGHPRGERAGTRAWALTGEWRFPLHMRHVPGSLLGFSLTSIAGSAFADFADAWCPASEPHVAGCTDGADAPLLSGGGEVVLDFGVLHNQRLRVRVGAAQPIRPGGPVAVYLSAGQAF